MKASTPASKAGIYKDDWLTHINGKQILNKQYLREQLGSLHLGDQFTMKKENLDEVRIIVGGSVEEDDEKATKNFSNLVFLSFTNETARLAPWEANAIRAGSISVSPIRRQDLDDHFAYMSDCDGNETAVTSATTKGVQFIEIGQNQMDKLWARGMFAENARCGYVLKNVSSRSAENDFVTVEVIEPPQHLCHMTLRSTSCKVFSGTSVTEVATNKFRFEHFDESCVVVLSLSFEDLRPQVSNQSVDSIKLAASFPPLLLRGGLRVLPVTVVDTEEKDDGDPQTFGVLVRIETSIVDNDWGSR